MRSVLIQHLYGTGALHMHRSILIDYHRCFYFCKVHLKEIATCLILSMFCIPLFLPFPAICKQNVQFIKSEKLI